MFIARDEFLRLNLGLQNEFGSALATASSGSWLRQVASDSRGMGVTDVRVFLRETVGVRVGPGTEYSDLSIETMQITHEQLSGGFVIEDRSYRTPVMQAALLAASRDLGEKVQLVKQRLVLDLINDNAKAYDGLAFFATGHFNNFRDTSEGVYDNTESGKALDATNLAAAIAAIEARVMSDGTPRNLKAKWLLHPPSLKKAANDASGAKVTTGNFIESTFGVVPVCVPGLAKVGGKDPWIVCAEHTVGSHPLAKPFGISTLIEPSITDFDGITAPHLAQARALECILAGDLAAFVGHPYLVHRCVVP